MDRIEPRQGPDLQDLTFRRAPRWSQPDSDHRFVLGVAIFLAVALAYPWYSYKVQAYLLARDLEAGVREFAQAADKELRQANAAAAQQHRQRSASSLASRVARVRVTGISEGNPPLAVVDLCDAGVFEAGDTICRQTELWLQRPLAGTVIRVQRFKSRGTLAPIEQLACP